MGLIHSSESRKLEIYFRKIIEKFSPRLTQSSFLPSYSRANLFGATRIPAAEAPRAEAPLAADALPTYQVAAIVDEVDATEVGAIQEDDLPPSYEEVLTSSSQQFDRVDATIGQDLSRELAAQELHEADDEEILPIAQRDSMQTTVHQEPQAPDQATAPQNANASSSD